MSFVIQQSTTALHILPAPHGTGITTRRRQGEVLVSDGTRTKPFYFDKVTYAPFHEALFAAVGNAALVQRGLTDEVHCCTWITGKPGEDVVWDVYKVFASNMVKGFFAKPSGPSDAQAATAVECSARCVYPWGVLDLVRNEELSGNVGADWNACGRKSIPDPASFGVVLHSVLRFLGDAAKGSTRQQLFLLQICLAPRHSSSATFTLTVSPPVTEVCRAFAVGPEALQEGLLRARRGRWVDHPLFKYLVAPSITTVDAFTLVTCVGGGEELLRGRKAGANLSTLTACGFASRGSAPAPKAAATSAVNSTASAMPSPVPVHKADVSVATATNEHRSTAELSSSTDSERETTATMELFAQPSRDASRLLLSSPPSSSVWGAPPKPTAEGTPAMWQETPLTYFGHFAGEKDKVPHAHPHIPASACNDAPDAVSSALAKVERELADRVRDKELRADEAIRAAEERMAQARRTELSARELSRNADAEAALVRARLDEEVREAQAAHDRLRRRRDEASADLERILARILESREEAAAMDRRVQESYQEWQRNLKASEADRERAQRSHDTWRQQCEEEARVVALFMERAQQNAVLFSSAIALHQETFAAAAASVHDATSRRFLVHTRALQEVTRQLDAATVELAETQERVDRSRTDIARTEQSALEELNSTARKVKHLRDTEKSLRETIAALQAQLDILRKQVEASAAAARSNRLEAEQVATRVNHQQRLAILANEETLERQRVCADWEEALASQFGSLVSALRVAASREQQRARPESEAFSAQELATEKLLNSSDLPPSAQRNSAAGGLEGFAFPPAGAASPSDTAAASRATIHDDVIELLQRKEQLKGETEAALSEINELVEIKEALESEVAAILRELDSAAGEVADAETVMLRESDRSLKILQLSAAESASQYSALLDRCTALIEMRSASRRQSVSMSNYSD